MKKIYIDESGDDGQVKGSSRYFILSAFVIDEIDEQKLYKIIRDLKKNNKEFRKNNEVKFSDLSEYGRKHFLKKLNNLNKEILVVVLDKGKLGKRFEKQYLLYEHVALKLAKEISYKKLEITIDLRNTKILRERINALFMKELKCKTLHDFSYNSIGLQFADMVAGCHFQKYEFNNNIYANLMEGDIKIIEIK